MRVPLIVLCGLLLTGCSPRAVDTSPSPSDPDILAGREIAAFTGSDLFQLIQRNRPLWLRTRGPVGPHPRGGVAVYRDGVRLGGLEQLHSVPVDGLRQVVHYSAPRATNRFGTGHPQGAIELIYGHARAAALFR